MSKNKNTELLKTLIDFILETVVDVELILEDKKVSFGETLSLISKLFKIPKIVKVFNQIDFDKLDEATEEIKTEYEDTNIDDVVSELLKIIANIKNIIALVKK
jgi:predicted dinucleotide-binding enzyme